MIDRYAVVGNPVAHSLSPLIHAEFAKQTKQSLNYEKILAPLQGFARTVTEFYKQGGRGINVTIPFKEEAWRLADILDPLAAQARSVNTLKFIEDGKIEGYITDGIGLLRDLKNNLKITINGKRVLLVGAGGAARGALVSLMRENPELLVISNRTEAKARQLVYEFREKARLYACEFSGLERWKFDVIINSTSVGLTGESIPLPEGIIAETGCCYDMVYGKHELPFLQWAQRQGVSCYVDGLGMLVEQAAESFYIWRGVRPKTKKLIEKLRKEL